MKTHSSRRKSFLLKYPVAFPTAYTKKCDSYDVNGLLCKLPALEDAAGDTQE